MLRDRLLESLGRPGAALIDDSGFDARRRAPRRRRGRRLARRRTPAPDARTGLTVARRLGRRHRRGPRRRAGRGRRAGGLGRRRPRSRPTDDAALHVVARRPRAAQGAPRRQGPDAGAAPPAGWPLAGLGQRHRARGLPRPPRPALLRPGRPHAALPQARAASRAAADDDGSCSLDGLDAVERRPTRPTPRCSTPAPSSTWPTTLDAEIEQTGGTRLLRRGRAAAGRPARRTWSRSASPSTPTTSRRSRPTSPARCATRRPRRSAVIGKEINLGSPKQLQVVLFDELGDAQDQAHQDRLHHRRRRPAGALREDRAPVPDGAAAAPRRDPAAADHRGPAQDRRSPTAASTRRSTRPIAATGRLSITDPNLQNIPIRTEEGRRIREGFVVGKGYDCLMTADYSQIEMRIMAHLSEDAGLIEAFRSGQDFHSITASRVFGVAGRRGHRRRSGPRSRR